MGVTWTTEQQKVISLRNRNILVSAAAGSGKTAVLVERIIQRLMDKDHPMDVDRLLVVTFTEAAASEMKERIRDAIEKKLTEEPENAHLQRQATLIHHAQITTIHSFCLSVIREYFHTIDLEPGFRTAEEGERKLLMQDVMEELLEEEYVKGEKEFLDFVEAVSPGRDDKKTESLIIELYEFSRSNPEPEVWLSGCVEGYRQVKEKPWDEIPFVKEAVHYTKNCLKDMDEILSYAKEICESPEGPAKYSEALSSDLKKIRDASQKEEFSQFQQALGEFKFDKLAANRDKTVSEEKINLVKMLREQVKKELSELRDQYFYEPQEELQQDMKTAAPFAEELVRLTIAFGKRFEEKKRSGNIIDFSDMEQYALRILKKEDVAEEYREKFEEIMIDEYQDSNLIQETLLTQISRIPKGIYNVFMVGDVKQSIYRFRLSRPELFMEKYDTYSLEEGQKQRIDLHKNFRSRGEVLDAVNFIFYQIMTKELGHVSYDKDAALYVGADFEKRPGFETELFLIEEGDVLDSKELEARMIARKIRELLKNQQVLDKETGTYRNVSYKDIVILLRSLKGWTETFTKILNEEGIPTFSGMKEGYFKTREISLLLDYLRVLDNEKQDLPLTAVLSSYFGKLTNEELAQIRCAYPNLPFYEAVQTFAKIEENKKLSDFLETVATFRKRVPYTAMHELLEEIVSETGYRNYILAMPGGVQRKANLDMLMEKAKAFERSGYKGLFHFLRYMEQLQKYNVDYGEANIVDEGADTVRIMSIHKSKGLEFPIVIVAGMGKKFNTQDVSKKVVIHQELGIGVDAVYLKDRMQIPSFLKKEIQMETRLENLGEELRVLYVALTRAKEKLIMTGTLKSPESKIQQFGRIKEQKEMALPFGILSKAGSYLDFLIPSVIRLEERKRKGEQIPLVVDTISEEEILMDSYMEEEKEQMTKEDLESLDVNRVYDEEMNRRLTESFRYVYPYMEQQHWSRKFTVSELKRQAYETEVPEQEESEMLIQEEPDSYIPEFMKEAKEVNGAQRGTAYHRFLQLLDFSKDYTYKQLEEEKERFVREGKLTKEAADAIWKKDILAFLASDCGKRIKEATKKGKLKKEQPFVLGVDAGRIYPQTEKKGDSEILLVQGIIDLYFEEEDGIVLLDYKTDHVKTEEELAGRYEIQLDYYQEALERSLNKKVKERLLYSFALQKTIRV